MGETKPKLLIVEDDEGRPEPPPEQEPEEQEMGEGEQQGKKRVHQFDEPVEGMEGGELERLLGQSSPAGPPLTCSSLAISRLARLKYSKLIE